MTEEAKELSEAAIDRATVVELRAAYRALLAEARELRAKISLGVRTTFDKRRKQNLKLGGQTPYGLRAEAGGKLRYSGPEQEMIDLILKMHLEKRSLRDISGTLAAQGFFARCKQPLQPKQIARIIRTHAKKKTKGVAP